MTNKIKCKKQANFKSVPSVKSYNSLESADSDLFSIKLQNKEVLKIHPVWEDDEFIEYLIYESNQGSCLIFDQEGSHFSNQSQKLFNHNSQVSNHNSQFQENKNGFDNLEENSKHFWEETTSLISQKLSKWSGKIDEKDCLMKNWDEENQQSPQINNEKKEFFSFNK